MAKKIKLENLTEEEEKKLNKVMIRSLVTALVCAVFVIICFACCIDPLPKKPQEESEKEVKRLYWLSVVSDTSWTVDVSANNDGVLDGMEGARRLRISNDLGSGNLGFEFLGEHGEVYANVTLHLESDDGEIDMGEVGIWKVHFSEKNGVYYISILDHGSHRVFYIKD